MHYTTSCNTQSSAPEDGQNNCPKHVELTGIINKLLSLHLVGCLCTVKQISDNEIYLLIKYIKIVLWRVAKRMSYIEDARCLKVKQVSCCLDVMRRAWQLPHHLGCSGVHFYGADFTHYVRCMLKILEMCLSVRESYRVRLANHNHV